MKIDAEDSRPRTEEPQAVQSRPLILLERIRVTHLRAQDSFRAALHLDFGS